MSSFFLRFRLATKALFGRYCAKGTAAAKSTEHDATIAAAKLKISAVDAAHNQTALVAKALEAERDRLHKNADDLQLKLDAVAASI